jgi:hypothetical protein
MLPPSHSVMSSVANPGTARGASAAFSFGRSMTMAARHRTPVSGPPILPFNVTFTVAPVDLPLHL